jgi:hypothetical protein
VSLKEREDNEFQQKERKMGGRAHFQFLQQHVDSHNRHFRRGNDSQNNRWNVRKGGPNGVFTLRGDAGSNSGGRRS